MEYNGHDKFVQFKLHPLAWNASWYSISFDHELFLLKIYDFDRKKMSVLSRESEFRKTLYPSGFKISTVIKQFNQD